MYLLEIQSERQTGRDGGRKRMKRRRRRRKSKTKREDESWGRERSSGS